MNYYIESIVSLILLFSSSMLFQSGAAAAATPAPAVTSRVVRFPLMIKESDLDEGDTWTDFLDDVKQGCQNHGTITSAVVITPDQKVSMKIGPTMALSNPCLIVFLLIC